MDETKGFYEYCQSKGWAKTASDTQISFGNQSDLFLQDDKARHYMTVLIEKPLKLFVNKLKSVKTKAGKPVGFETCMIPIRDTGVFSIEHGFDNYTSFWGNICEDLNIPFLDISNQYLALNKTFWPFDEWLTHQHLSAGGHFLFAYILAHELIQKQVIPFHK